MAEENRKHFNAPMDSSKQLAVYTKKQECCQAFAADIGNPISMADMVQMGVVHAVATGVMHNAYCKWECIPKPEQMWNNWKEHFNNVFNKLKKLNAITTESMGYGASHITEHTVACNAT